MSLKTSDRCRPLEVFSMIRSTSGCPPPPQVVLEKRLLVFQPLAAGLAGQRVVEHRVSAAEGIVGADLVLHEIRPGLVDRLVLAVGIQSKILIRDRELLHEPAARVLALRDDRVVYGAANRVMAVAGIKAHAQI